jgi:RPA family protein
MRERAWRIFAGEYNESSCRLEGKEQRDPSYVISALGAKINRLYFVGVLTDVENIASENEMLRARISDPTGIYNVYAGQYQPEAMQILTELVIPSFVAVVGKSRAYEPEEGVMYVSVRPELIQEVDSNMRNYWILETCRHTMKRIDGIMEAMAMNSPDIGELIKLGYDKELADGAAKAVTHYDAIDLDYYRSLIKEALTQVTVEGTQHIEEIEEAEKQVLSLVNELEEDRGIPWDNLVEIAMGKKLEKEVVEGALSSLMKKGLIYEPILGRIKTT